MLAVSSDKVQIGRSKHCNGVITGNTFVSTQHCTITRHVNKENPGPVFTVLDTRHSFFVDTLLTLFTSSFNGTFINGVKIGKGKEAELRPGDVLSLASGYVLKPGVVAFKLQCNNNQPKSSTTSHSVLRAPTLILTPLKIE